MKTILFVMLCGVCAIAAVSTTKEADLSPAQKAARQEWASRQGVKNPTWTNYWMAVDLSWRYASGPTSTVFQVFLGMEKAFASSTNQIGVLEHMARGNYLKEALRLKDNDTLGTTPPPPYIDSP